MPKYKTIHDSIYTGRTTTGGVYVHERIQYLDLNTEIPVYDGPNITLIGYACDEGVRRNEGRTGAKQGPDHIRKQWARLPWHETSIGLFDAGTISCDSKDLEATQEALGVAVFRLLKAGYFPVVLGGGHDMTFGNFLGVHRFLGEKKEIGIINFDAHLDLRVPEIHGNSGTPFYQIHEGLVSLGLPFHYACLGMRLEANAPELVERARAWNVLTVERADFHIGKWDFIKKQLDLFLEPLERCILTIDMDGFSSAFSPGVSAASPLGFAPDIVLKCLDYLAKTRKVVSMDIAEVNPRFDRDDQTAKMAATLIHGFGHGSAHSSQDL